MSVFDVIGCSADELLNVGVAMAARGANVIRDLHGETGTISFKSSPTDAVTAADAASDTAIRGVLAARRVGDGLISEDGPPAASSTALRWVVDPLDGTTNYVHGLPHIAVSVACEALVDGAWQAIVGVVSDVLRDEVFSAVLGCGARLGEAAISVNEPVTLSRAVVATGFGYRPAVRQRQADALRRVAPIVADVRATGSSALDLCWTAAGRIDAYWEDELSPWDWAAGRLIVREAGGWTSVLGDGILAAGPHLHAELDTLLTG
ncbi:inositol monophosphatase/fructose-1,6-bisphosphatase family protein [Saccharomonospora marina XMU15]|uniref:inositol-phosphate phosphatase n=1 Tax=Saccharomonospora marina XMU15 TaxID=882083 RepID=H5X6Z3_9PSEU|nr:inositol monophosphatase family protein [Saccharomonospora marina]EHR52423.1 inositol monophosphatase/fructose-1,6-bisphosphatase family protein [Saccharomonospora marina XMU15]